MSAKRQLAVFFLSLTLTLCVRGQRGGQGIPQNGQTPTSNGTTGKEPPPHPLSVFIADAENPGLVLLHFEETTVVHFNYTLECDHSSTIYTVTVKSTHPEVASIESSPSLNVSCADAVFQDRTPDSSSHETKVTGVTASNETTTASGSGITTAKVTGKFNVTFDGDTIGRSFLLMFANKISGPRRLGYSSTAAGNSTPMSRSAKSQDGAITATPPNTVLTAMILVVRFLTIYDEIFRISSYVVIVLATTGMGIKTDFKVIVTVLKKPLAPAIGLFCQYVCMPLIAYGIARVVPQPSPAVSLGIFTCGIVPGGGASNFYCYLLGGDISLSVTMTTISSIVAMGLIPFWLYVLGDSFQDDMSRAHVPFLKILETLAIVVLPIFLGMLIKYKAPRLAKIISKILKPVLLVVVIFFMTAAIYLNFYIFEMIQPMQILAGCLLPYIGYLIGGLLALVFRQPWIRIKTIAIETGIQNVGIAFLILFLSLPPPDNLLSVVAPAASAIMTPLPLLVVTVAYLIYNKRKGKKLGERVPVDDSDENADDTKAIQGKPAMESTTEKKGGIWGLLSGFFKDSTPSEADQEMLSKEMTIVNDKSALWS